MKIFSYGKATNEKEINLGGKIKFDKLNSILNTGGHILIRNVQDGMQTDYRIRRIPQAKKMDRGYKIIKAYYIVNFEMGNEGFEKFIPKRVVLEQNLRFHSLDRAINMLELKQNLKRADWIIG